MSSRAFRLSLSLYNAARPCHPDPQPLFLALHAKKSSRNGASHPYKPYKVTVDYVSQSAELPDVLAMRRGIVFTFCFHYDTC